MTMKTRIKMPANTVVKVTNNFYLEAQFVVNELLKNEFIKKKKDNVIASIENLTYNNYEIIGAEYDLLTNEIVLELQL